MTLKQLTDMIHEDPLSTAFMCVRQAKVLLRLIQDERERNEKDTQHDVVSDLSGLAEDQCDLIEGCLEHMLREIEEGRIPGRPGAPGQYKRTEEPALN